MVSSLVLDCHLAGEIQAEFVSSIPGSATLVSTPVSQGGSLSDF